MCVFVSMCGPVMDRELNNDLGLAAAPPVTLE